MFDDDLETMSPAALEAMRLNLQAAKLELQRAVNLQGLVPIDDVAEVVSEILAVTKSLFIAIPGRIADACSIASAEEARALIAKEVEEAVAPLEGKH